MLKIEIIAAGIIGGDKELAIGETFDVDHVPAGWAEKVRIISDDEGKVGITNPVRDDAAIAELRATFDKSHGELLRQFAELQAERDGLQLHVNDLTAQLAALSSQELKSAGKIEARDTGAGWWAIFDAEGKEFGKKIRKDEAEAFNAFSEDEKVEYLKTE